MKKKILKESLQKIKPIKSFWGIGSAILVFIVPEIVAFIWGGDIKNFTDSMLATPLPFEQEYAYKILGEIMAEGSWLNLLIGVAIVVWAFF